MGMMVEVESHRKISCPVLVATPRSSREPWSESDRIAATLAELYIERISGPVAFWQRLNLGFMLELRKQFLIWQTLKEDFHAEHVATARREALEAGEILDRVETN